MSIPQPPDLLVLRHGETEWNRAGRMQGRLDSPLTETGRAQARAQGQILRDMGVVAGAGGWQMFVSPQGRALATAQIALGPDVAMTTDPRLAEIDVGQWNGQLRRDIQAQAPHLFADPDRMIWYDHAPQGEGLGGLAARAAQFLAGLTGPSVIVTHDITSRMLRCLALGHAAAEFDRMEGGQGIIYHLSGGIQKRLTLGA